MELKEIVPAYDVLHDEIEMINGGMTGDGDCSSGCHDGLVKRLETYMENL